MFNTSLCIKCYIHYIPYIPIKYMGVVNGAANTIKTICYNYYNGIK
jgi:hypothetical protein